MNIISLTDYFRDYAKPDEHVANARILLARVNSLLAEAEQCGLTLRLNKATQSYIGGSKWGGYRTPECNIGVEKSAHKQGMAVDIFDPVNELDRWITDDILKRFDLYREHPDHTETWCHLDTRKRKNRTFIP